MDWKTLIEEIQSAGFSQVAIALRMNKSQAWVSAVLSGKYDDLKWSDGQALIALRAELVSAPGRPTARPSDDCGRRVVEDLRDAA